MGQICLDRELVLREIAYAIHERRTKLQVGQTSYRIRTSLGCCDAF